MERVRKGWKEEENGRRKGEGERGRVWERDRERWSNNFIKAKKKQAKRKKNDVLIIFTIKLKMQKIRATKKHQK